MKVSFHKRGWEDYMFWQSTDKKTLKKVNEWIKQCCRAPYEGIGKPEPLKENLAGWWSRRITHEHRLVYKFEKDQLLIL